jgi:hypothetical protein
LTLLSNATLCSLSCPIDFRWTPDESYNCTWTLVDSRWTPLYIDY